VGSLLALLKELLVALAGGVAGVMRSRRERDTLELPAAGIHRCPACGHRCTYCKRALTQSSDPPRDPPTLG
jgi:hypothetical protein